MRNSKPHTDLQRCSSRSQHVLIGSNGAEAANAQRAAAPLLMWNASWQRIHVWQVQHVGAVSRLPPFDELVGVAGNMEVGISPLKLGVLAQEANGSWIGLQEPNVAVAHYGEFQVVK